MAEEEFEKKPKDVLSYVPENYVPVFIERERGLLWIDKKYVEDIISQNINKELRKWFPYIIAMVNRRVNRLISSLKPRYYADYNLIGALLCGLLLAVSAGLSTIFFLLNLPDIAMSYIYSAIASLGGLIFTLYRGKKKLQSVK